MFPRIFSRCLRNKRPSCKIDIEDYSPPRPLDQCCKLCRVCAAAQRWAFISQRSRLLQGHLPTLILGVRGPEAFVDQLARWAFISQTPGTTPLRYELAARSVQHAESFLDGVSKMLSGRMCISFYGPLGGRFSTL